MFTGIVTAEGAVQEAGRFGAAQDLRLVIAAPQAFLAAHGGTEIGASIACSGVCLTVTALEPDRFTVDVSQATVSRTLCGDWTPGTRINLERALRMGDELGGHIVTGHVDGIADVLAAEPVHGSRRLCFAVPPPLHRFIAEKGSVAIDGVSLTVNAVRGTHFDVNVIPHTAAHTTLGVLAPGRRAHVEIDLLARYAARLAETA